MCYLKECIRTDKSAYLYGRVAIPRLLQDEGEPGSRSPWTRDEGNGLRRPLGERRIGMPDCVPTEIAHDSDFHGGWLQVRIVERTRPVRMFAVAAQAGEYTGLVDRICRGRAPPPHVLSYSIFLATSDARPLLTRSPQLLRKARHLAGSHTPNQACRLRRTPRRTRGSGFPVRR